ncbi:MAG: hypothetical protein Q8O67_17110 [Deltaproteobacteria bacterium]|nr:hypothetical protein [Deltaproteobacteria bacterium]
MIEPVLLHDTALRIAELHLRHEDWATTRTMILAVAQAPRVEEEDFDIDVDNYADVLELHVLRLLGVPW